MLSLQEFRKLLANDSISDEEAEAMRLACYELAGIVLEDWRRRWPLDDAEGNEIAES